MQLSVTQRRCCLPFLAKKRVIAEFHFNKDLDSSPLYACLADVFAPSVEADKATDVNPLPVYNGNSGVTVYVVPLSIHNGNTGVTVHVVPLSVHNGNSGVTVHVVPLPVYNGNTGVTVHVVPLSVHNGNSGVTVHVVSLSVHNGNTGVTVQVVPLSVHNGNTGVTVHVVEAPRAVKTQRMNSRRRQRVFFWGWGVEGWISLWIHSNMSRRHRRMKEKHPLFYNDEGELAPIWRWRVFPCSTKCVMSGEGRVRGWDGDCRCVEWEP